MADQPIVSLDKVSFEYVSGPGWARVRTPVLREFSLDIAPGEMVGLVGESGSGKTTIGRLCLGLIRPSSGRVLLDGRPMPRRHQPGSLAVVLQHPQWSLNPRASVGKSVSEPLVLAGVDRAHRRRRVAEILEQVGLNESFTARYPAQLSGGQRQRVSIARALVTEPRFILFDEAVSALDVSIQAQILNLIKALQAQHGFGAIFISHDLAATRYVAGRILVLRQGTVEHEGDAESFYRPSDNPYTRRLQLASDL